MIPVKELPAVTEVDKDDVVAAVMVHNEIVAYSKGKSGRYAKERAAKGAVEKIEGLSQYEFKARYGCDCTDVDAGMVDGQEEIASADCNV